MPFRWSEARHDVALAREVAQNSPEITQEWENIAENLSALFNV